MSGTDGIKMQGAGALAVLLYADRSPDVFP